MPPTAVLSGLMILTGYCTSHATVSVPGTEWEEPILVWISVGLYDELSSFLTQINLYKGRGLSDSHDLSLFLQLYIACCYHSAQFEVQGQYILAFQNWSDTSIF